MYRSEFLIQVCRKLPFAISTAGVKQSHLPVTPVTQGPWTSLFFFFLFFIFHATICAIHVYRFSFCLFGVILSLSFCCNLLMPLFTPKTKYCGYYFLPIFRCKFWWEHTNLAEILKDYWIAGVVPLPEKVYYRLVVQTSFMPE